MVFSGKLLSNNQYKYPILIITAQVKKNIDLNISNELDIIYRKENISSTKELIIFKRIQNCSLINNGKIIKLDLNNAEFNLKIDEISISSLNLSYKGLNIPDKMFGVKNNINNANVHIKQLCNGDKITVLGIKKDDTIFVNQIQKCLKNGHP